MIGGPEVLVLLVVVLTNLAVAAAVISSDEWVLVMNALNEVLHGPHAIDERQFHARLGVHRADALALQRRLDEEQ